MTTIYGRGLTVCEARLAAQHIFPVTITIPEPPANIRITWPCRARSMERGLERLLRRFISIVAALENIQDPSTWIWTTATLEDRHPFAVEGQMTSCGVAWAYWPEQPLYTVELLQPDTRYQPKRRYVAHGTAPH